MFTYEITIVCDGCKAVYSTGDPQLAPHTDVTVSGAWTKGWRFPKDKHYCPECAKKGIYEHVLQA